MSPITYFELESGLVPCAIARSVEVTTMVVEYIRYNVADEQGNAFESAYEQAASALIASPHCLRYELARCEVTERVLKERR